MKDAEVSLKTAEAALEANRAVLEQKESLHKDCLEQVRKCKIYAPRSGQVVRGVREEKGDGPEAKQTMVARGDNVRYGQKLLTIPDLSVMAIQVRLHEGLIGYLRKGQSATVEVAGLKPLRAHVADVAAGADAKEERPELTVKYYSATLHFDEPVDELSHRRGAKGLVYDCHRPAGRARPCHSGPGGCGSAGEGQEAALSGGHTQRRGGTRSRSWPQRWPDGGNQVGTERG